MSVKKKYLRELEVFSGSADPLANKTPQELCTIALDEVSPNRLSAIKRLGSCHGSGVTQILMMLTGDHYDLTIRQQALEALVLREDVRVAQRFEQLIHDDNPEMRRSIVRIARRASDQVQAVVSTCALKDDDESVRELAEETFFGIPDPDPEF